jgi:hypothetical protein
VIEQIRSDIESMRARVRDYRALLYAEEGAIKYAEHLLNILEGEDSISVQEFAEMVGGAGAKAEIIPNDNSDPTN